MKDLEGSKIGQKKVLNQDADQTPVQGDREEGGPARSSPRPRCSSKEVSATPVMSG